MFSAFGVEHGDISKSDFLGEAAVGAGTIGAGMALWKHKQKKNRRPVVSKANRLDVDEIASSGGVAGAAGAAYKHSGTRTARAHKLTRLRDQNLKNAKSARTEDSLGNWKQAKYAAKKGFSKPAASFSRSNKFAEEASNLNSQIPKQLKLARASKAGAYGLGATSAGLAVHGFMPKKKR